MTNLAAISILDALDEIMDSEETKIEGVKNNFALRLDRVMKRKQVSQKDLAEKLSFSQAYVSKILSGNGNLSIKTMVKFASAVGVDLDFQLVDKDAVSASTDWSHYVTRKSHRARETQASNDVWYGLDAMAGCANA